MALISLTEEAEMDSERVRLVEELCGLGVPLNSLHLAVLSSAFRNVIAPKRIAWMSLRSRRPQPALVGRYLDRIQGELEECALRGVRAVERAVRAVGCEEDVVFCCRLKGDFFHYMVENLEEGERRRALCVQGEESYAEGVARASGLPLLHPARLGILLNYCNFLHQALQETPRAISLTQEVLRTALPLSLQHPPKDSQYLLSLLSDNLTLWMED
uniref:14-3-3 domain-containing protein n=1 Tax=Arcella intermedia TaxID=1963864 RepID=A0A6B2LHZ5_9EUKA